MRTLPLPSLLRQLSVYVFLLMLFMLNACTTKESAYVYDVNHTEILPANANKDKLKTPEQYVAILHVNLFQEPLSSNDIYDVASVILSIGDKDLAYEVLISNFMNEPDVILPSNEDMRADIPTFIESTYERFFLRSPSAAEKEYFTKYINSRPNITPEFVYVSFAIANEYQFY